MSEPCHSVPLGQEAPLPSRRRSSCVHQGGGRWGAVAERRISLKYATTCRRCRRIMPSGTIARWNTETKWIACLQCPDPTHNRPASAAPDGMVRRARPVAEGLVSPTAAPTPIDPGWDELIRYHLACVRRAGLA